tara:strand:+ start:345 stop:755 length:411 start_codon:yes stop_codon:yes gene_type:complete
MASTLKINTLTGVTTAGSIAVTGEGNSTTTNLQQGLTKHWLLATGDGISVEDSFNSSGITDNGPGDGTFAFTNNFANGNFSTTALSTEDGTIGYVTMYYDRSYSRNGANIRLQGIDEGDSYDDGSIVSTMSTGDLA